MSPEEIENLLREIVAGIEASADVASVLAPQIIPYVVLGKALDKIVPGIAGIVTRWIEGNPPTDAEKTMMRQKLAVLEDPNNP